MSNRLANVIVFLIEIGIGLLCGAVVAAFTIPLTYTERGYFAIGAEWFFIIGAAYAGFSAINKYIFDSVERS